MRDHRLRPGRPLRDRAGHDMNYLGLVGLLGLTGEAGGPPVRPAGQIADIGGGALMAAFGILAALRVAERTGEGQVVDVAMADGALSWLAMVAARCLADGELPARGGLELAGGHRLLPALRVRRRRLGDARRARAEVLGGVVSRRRARGPRRASSSPRPAARPRRASRRSSRPHAGRVGGVRRRARVLPGAGLDLGEALSSEHVAAREMVAGWISRVPRAPVRWLGSPVKLSRTPADHNRLPGPELGEHSLAVLRSRRL